VVVVRMARRRWRSEKRVQRFLLATWISGTAIGEDGELSEL